MIRQSPIQMSDKSFLNIEVQDISDEEASLTTDSPLWQTLSDHQQETIQGGMLDAFSKVVSQSDTVSSRLILGSKLVM